MNTLKDYIINKLGTFNEENAWIFVIIKPGFETLSQAIIEEFTTESPAHTAWQLSKVRTKMLLPQEARELYKIHKKEEWYEDLWKYMSSGKTTGLLFVKPEEKMSKKIFKEVDEIKDYIRDKYGESEMRNVIHSSDSLEHMKWESSIYFVV